MEVINWSLSNRLTVNVDVMKTLIETKLIIFFYLCLLSSETKAQRILELGLLANSYNSIKCPDSSSILAKLILGDTDNIVYFNTISPDSIVVDKKKKIVRYRRFDGEMIDCSITNIQDPMEFGLIFQVYELKFRSGVDGKLTILELTQYDKMVIMEWVCNGYCSGFISQIKEESAVNIDSLINKHKQRFLNRIVK